MDLVTTLPAVVPTTFRATSATSDEMLVASWIAGLTSKHSKRNSRRTADRFLAALAPLGLRDATIEDIRSALDTITTGLAPSSRSTTVGQVKSLLSYGTKLGYLPFNAGVTIKNKADHRNLAKRIVSEVDIALLIRHADNSKQARKGGQGHRNRVMPIKTSLSGKAWCAMKIAIGQDDATQWVRVALFGELAQQLAPILQKGDRVYVEGTLRLDRWKNDAGEERSGLSVAAWKVEKLGNIGRNKPAKPKSLPEGDHNPPPATRDWQAPSGNSYALAKESDRHASMEDEIPF
jgi:single-stranded DNA-binding protein